MELHSSSRLSRAAIPTEVCERYVDRLSLSGEERSRLLAPADVAETADTHSATAADRASDTAAAMAALHGSLAHSVVDCDNPAYASIEKRLDAAYGASCTEAGVIGRDVHDAVRVVSVPPLNRTSMSPKEWPLTWLAHLLRVFKRPLSARRADAQALDAAADADSASPDARGRWHRVGTLRRLFLTIVVLAQTYVATDFMTAVLPYHGGKLIEVAILILFAVLFCWVSAGFWTAVMGFWVLATGRDRYNISATVAKGKPLDPAARTAIVMPICNEDVARVFAGLRATYESLARTGELAHFDFYVLSDTGNPDARVAEKHAWLELCRAVGGFGRVFYRWRQHHIKRKSGNIADFCRRWGRNYRYMVILDADSVMSGKCLTTLARMMEANPNAGIIQTAPRAAGHDTLYTRVQQFANRVYGPVFVAGMHYFQLGEAHYWGHNAIIRMAPFIRYCALARLPGTGSLSGDILSHDFVEAALMRRAGWAVWIAYDLQGSYEEMPPNLIDELKRDRRWCQGNLINSRLAFAQGLHPAHRAVFLTGVMAYVSAPLWFAFLLLSTVLLAIHTLVEPEYFVKPMQLFPQWPEWHPDRGIGLYAATATLLFLPKVLSVILAWAQGAREVGGGLRLAGSAVAELMFSALLAPVRMLFHTQFVLSALCGWTIQWKSPPRENAETAWADALRHHGWHTLLGLVWAGIVYWLNPAFLWWLLPVVGALIVSIPISVYSSRVALGERLRRASFFLIPEEVKPPRELSRTQYFLEHTPAPPGFVDAVVHPVTNALTCASKAARVRANGTVNEESEELIQHALVDGPATLSAAQKATLLRDPLALSRLHFQVWTSPEAHAGWSAAARDKAPVAKADAATRPVSSATGAPLPDLAAPLPPILPAPGPDATSRGLV